MSSLHFLFWGDVASSFTQGGESWAIHPINPSLGFCLQFGPVLFLFLLFFHLAPFILWGLLVFNGWRVWQSSWGIIPALGLRPPLHGGMRWEGSIMQNRPLLFHPAMPPCVHLRFDVIVLTLGVESGRRSVWTSFTDGPYNAGVVIA